MKKTIAILSAILMVSLLLSSCKDDRNSLSSNSLSSSTANSNSQTQTEPKITDGIYVNKFTPEGRSEYLNYFRFYENGIYFYSFYSDGMCGAGYWELVEEDKDVIPDPKDAPDKKATVKKIVKMTSLDGEAFDTCGFDEKVLYNIESLYNKNFDHVLDSGHKDSDEKGIPLAEYQLGDDAYSLIRIMHNGTFEDTTGSIINGTWQKDGNKYTLIDDSKKEAVLTLAEDGATATYVNFEGQSQTLNKTVTEE